MVFGHNELRLENSNGFAYSINAIDALKLVDNCHEPLKVAYSAQWKASRCGESASLMAASHCARTTDLCLKRSMLWVLLLARQGGGRGGARARGGEAVRLDVHHRLRGYAGEPCGRTCTQRYKHRWRRWSVALSAAPHWSLYTGWPGDRTSRSPRTWRSITKF